MGYKHYLSSLSSKTMQLETAMNIWMGDVLSVPIVYRTKFSKSWRLSFVEKWVDKCNNHIYISLSYAEYTCGISKNTEGLVRKILPFLFFQVLWPLTFFVPRWKIDNNLFSNQNQQISIASLKPSWSWE